MSVKLALYPMEAPAPVRGEGGGGEAGVLDRLDRAALQRVYWGIQQVTVRVTNIPRLFCIPYRN